MRTTAQATMVTPLRLRRDSHPADRDPERSGVAPSQGDVATKHCSPNPNLGAGSVLRTERLWVALSLSHSVGLICPPTTPPTVLLVRILGSVFIRLPRHTHHL